RTPREAVKAIASLWQEKAAYMACGEVHPTLVIGSGQNDEELAPLLASRAGLLLEWVEDDEAWSDEASQFVQAELASFHQSHGQKACHGFGSTTQVGLTQVLGPIGEIR